LLQPKHCLVTSTSGTYIWKWPNGSGQAHSMRHSERCIY